MNTYVYILFITILSNNQINFASKDDALIAES